MQNLQEVFNQIQVIKREQKEIKTAYRDALVNSGEYQKAAEDLKVLKEKKKSLEASIKEQFLAEFDKLDRLKIDIESQNLMLADIAMNKLMKGETVEIVDQDNNVYEPVFTVRFKKSGAIKSGPKAASSAEKSQLSGAIPEINHAFD